MGSNYLCPVTVLLNGYGIYPKLFGSSIDPVSCSIRKIFVTDMMKLRGETPRLESGREGVWCLL